MNQIVLLVICMHLTQPNCPWTKQFVTRIPIIDNSYTICVHIKHNPLISMFHIISIPLRYQTICFGSIKILPPLEVSSMVD